MLHRQLAFDQPVLLGSEVDFPERFLSLLSGTFPKNGPLRFGSEKCLPSNFAQ